MLAHALLLLVTLDRVAVTVDNYVITESEVLEEIRVTAFQNGAPLDLGPASRKQAAERLIDQQLIRNEMRLSGFRQPDVSKALAEFKEKRFHGDDGAYRAALKRYGLIEDELKSHLEWQAAALQFTDYRFGSGIDQQMDAWPKQAREGAHIRFIKEAFE